MLMLSEEDAARCEKGKHFPFTYGFNTDPRTQKLGEEILVDWHNIHKALGTAFPQPSPCGRKEKPRPCQVTVASPFLQDVTYC